METSTVQAHRTTISATTADHRRPLELGDRLTFVIEAVVTGVGVKRHSGGDVEVRTLTASDVVEVDPDAGGTLADAIDEARKARKAASDEAAGLLTLDLDGVDLFLVSLSCGHDSHYPEAWIEREERTEDPDAARYWRERERPEPGGQSPCPVCYATAEADGKPLEPGTVSDVVTVARIEAGAGTATVPGPDTLDEADEADPAPWEGYDGQSATVIRDALEALPDTDDAVATAAAVRRYELEHKARRAVLSAAGAIVDGAATRDVEPLGDTDEEERF